MLIGREEEHIELELLERVPEHLPTPGDVRVRATVKLQEFGGSYSGVWLAQPDLAKFVEQLKSLRDNRQGSAKIEAMIPDEFSLEFRPLDSLGHLEATVRLGCGHYRERSFGPTILTGGFEIEPSQLESVLDAFQTLLEPNGPS
jgi:hypothetical protein